MRRWLAAGSLVALLAGCSSNGSTGAGPPIEPGPSRADLVRVADLAPCPTSTSEHGDLPDVTLPCLGDGPAVHLAGLAGEPTVVNIWGAWCTQCQKESSYLARAYDADKKSVRFLGVDTKDTDDNALDFAAHVDPPMRYPSIVDSDNKVLLGLHFPAPPLTVLVDANGNIVHRHGGPYASTAQLQRDIAAYLHVRT